jgi:hypothetical protein
MDAQKLQHLYQRLEGLDERLTHRVRPRQPSNMGRLNPRQLEDRVKDLSQYTVELKEIIGELVVSLRNGARPG